IVMTGGGTVTNEEIVARRAQVEAQVGDLADVVVFRPSELGYTPFDVAVIESFLLDHGDNLNNQTFFLATSAAASPLEQLYNSSSFPKNFGGLWINQPFFPFVGDRPPLTDKVQHDMYVVTDIAMSTDLQKFYGTGPSIFTDKNPSAIREYLVLGEL